MADINQRINEIKEYFNGMQVETIDNLTYIYVIVKLPSKWKINYNETVNKFKVEVTEDNVIPGKFYFIATMETGFDKVFDAIEYNIQRMKVIVERSQLLKQKITELQEIFSNEEITIESLRTLEFKYKVPKSKTNKTEKKEIKSSIDTIEKITEEENIEKTEGE